MCLLKLQMLKHRNSNYFMHNTLVFPKPSHILYVNCVIEIYVAININFMEYHGFVYRVLPA